MTWRITSLFCNACFPLLLLQRKEKEYLFVINTLFFVLISTHKTQRGNLWIILLPISFRAIQEGYLLCQTYMLLLYSTFNASETLLIHSSNQFHKGKPSLTLSSPSSALPWLCIVNSKGFSVSHTYFTNMATWFHWPQMKTTRMQIQQSKQPNFDVSHYLHKLTRFVLHCIWLQK